MFGGSPWKKENAKAYEEQSPLTYAGAITTPTLILHDTGDRRVPITNAYALYHALNGQRCHREIHRRSRGCTLSLRRSRAQVRVSESHNHPEGVAEAKLSHDTNPRPFAGFVEKGRHARNQKTDEWQKGWPPPLANRPCPKSRMTLSIELSLSTDLRSCRRSR